MNRDALIVQLLADEGEVFHAYQVNGLLHIGVGHLIDERKGGKISQAASRFILNEDVDNVERELTANLDFYNTLDPVRQMVLANMCFQLGIGGLLEFKKTLGLIRLKAYARAATEMLNSLWATQVPVRAHRLSTMMATGKEK